MTAVPRGKAAVVIVVATIATLFLALFLTAQPSGGVCNGCGIGEPPFSVGNPIAGNCPSGGTFATRGCVSGDFTYNLTIETSSIRFGEVLFHIDTADSNVYVATGPYSGFSILTLSGSLAAHYQTVGGVMNMTSGWIYVGGFSALTPLSSVYTIVVDVGTVNPHGQGLAFAAVGTGSYSWTAILTLP